MHRCPSCGSQLSWSFIIRIQKWSPSRGCPSCGQALTHAGMLKSGGAGVIGISAYQIMKLYMEPWLALTIVLSVCFIFGYREYQSLKIMPSDAVMDNKIKSSIALSPTASKTTACFGAIGSFLLLVGCIFIVAVLSNHDSANLEGFLLFSVLGLVGLGGFIMSVRMLRGKSLLHDYPLRKL